MILALACKAVRAVKVAGMCNVQTKRLNHARGLCFKSAGHCLKCIAYKKLAAVFKCKNVVIALDDLVKRYVFIFFGSFFNYLAALRFFKARDNVIRDIVNNVNRARAYVDNDIISAKLVLMNHKKNLPEFINLC